jgi:RNA polymerase sigma-70 factor (ECF subfamily)
MIEGTMHGDGHQDRSEAASDGDRTALCEWYDRLSPSLFGYLTDMTHDPNLAEDLLHQVWVRVIEREKTRRAPFRPWVFTIARNLALDALRAHKRSRQVELADGPCPNPGPHEVAADREYAQRLRNAVQSLSEDRREIVLLRFYSGLTFKEIAGILGCPLGTAATRLRKALTELREMLHSEQPT